MARNALRIALELFVARIEETLVARIVVIDRLITIGLGRVVLRVGVRFHRIGVVLRGHAIGRNVEARHVVAVVGRSRGCGHCLLANGGHRDGARRHALGGLGVVDARRLAQEVGLIGEGRLERAHSLLHLAQSNVGLTKIRIHLVARCGIHVELQRAFIRCHGIGRTIEGHEAYAQVEQRLARIGVARIERGLAECDASFGVFAKLQKRIAHAQIGLVRSVVFGIGGGDFKMRHGVFVIVLENVRFAQVAIHRAHGIVSGIGGRLSVRLDSRIEIFQLQQAVAQLVIQIPQIARALRHAGILEQLDVCLACGLEVACLVCGLRLGYVLVVHEFLSSLNTRESLWLVGVFDFDSFNDIAHAKLADDIFALDGLAEHGVARVEIMLGTQAQIELRARGIGVRAASHSQRAVFVGVVRVGGVLLLDAVARAACAKASPRVAGGFDDLRGIEVAGVGAAALNDEAGNIAMELEVVVEALASELNEVAHVDGGVVASELNSNVALGGFDDGDFLAVGLILGGIQCHSR